MVFSAMRSSSAVVMPGSTASPTRRRARADTRPASFMASICTGDFNFTATGSHFLDRFARARLPRPASLRMTRGNYLRSFRATFRTAPLMNDASGQLPFTAGP